MRNTFGRGGDWWRHGRSLRQGDQLGFGCRDRNSARGLRHAIRMADEVPSLGKRQASLSVAVERGDADLIKLKEGQERLRDVK